jgi:hypothetical protein
MSAKANASILRRLTHLSHWFASPILWFGALYGRGANLGVRRLRAAKAERSWPGFVPAIS